MNARLFIKRNSATILSFVAVAGVVATAITSANATPKAVRALDTAKLNKGEEELTKIEKVKNRASSIFANYNHWGSDCRMYSWLERIKSTYSSIAIKRIRNS